jgi:hydroxymethylpyrimidine/phosphomethylpyrimidine kinase
MKKCLSIAGFDGSGGAGIQADLKTFTIFGCYGMNVLTALPVQNTCGVRRCYELPLSSIQDQLEAIFDDITPDSIKIGMLFNSDIIEIIANFLRVRAVNIPIILDPVMVAKSGDLLLQKGSIEMLKSKLIPLAAVITPNLPEAQELISSRSIDQIEIAKELLELGPKAVLVKGGHLIGEMSNDLLLQAGLDEVWMKSPRINSKNTHGTGCTLSAAIAACLALGMNLEKACMVSKQYLFNAIKSAKKNKIGQGNGPVNHLYNMEDNNGII